MSYPHAGPGKLCHWKNTNATYWISAPEWILFWFVFWQTRLLPVNFFCWNYLLEVFLLVLGIAHLTTEKYILNDGIIYLFTIPPNHQTKTFKSPNTQKSIHTRLHCHPVVSPTANASHAHNQGKSSLPERRWRYVMMSRVYKTLLLPIHFLALLTHSLQIFSLL